MSSTGTPTPHLGLNQWLPNDKPERVDFDSDNLKIDAALKSMAHLTSADFTVLKRGGNTVWDAGNFVVESGTWTPTLLGSTTTGTHTILRAYGRFMRMNSFVLITGYFAASDISGFAGEIRLGGLPFVASSAQYMGYNGFAVAHNNLTNIVAYLSTAASNFIRFYMADGVTNTSAIFTSHANTSGYLAFSGIYYIGN